PNDPESPFVTSGVRLGTPAVTTRGMGEPEMALIAQLIARVLADPTTETTDAVQAEVRSLCQRFPIHTI
ncbi:serine hydroxymethyltransferase, partial [Acinetobacter baumannii]